MLAAAAAAGGAGAALAPVAIQITQANAKPVGAHAADSAQNTGAAQGSIGLIAGVQIQGDGSGGYESVVNSTASELRALL